jgi:hypothetical protein
MKNFSDKPKETLFCHKGENFLVEFQKFHENFVCFCQTKALSFQSLNIKKIFLMELKNGGE